LTTYAGTGIGLINGIKPAAGITREVAKDAISVMKRLGNLLETPPPSDSALDNWIPKER
jgi:hypothetical protein